MGHTSKPLSMHKYIEKNFHNGLQYASCDFLSIPLLAAVSHVLNFIMSPIK